MNKKPAVIPFLPSLSLFVIGAVIGIGAAYDPQLSLFWFASLLGGFLVYLIVATMLRSRPGIGAAFFTAWGVAYSAMLLLQYRHLDFDEKLRAAAWLGRITSAPFPDLIPIFVDANAAASFIVPIIPLALGLALTARGPARLVWSGALAMLLIGAILTASRGAFVALAAALMLWGALYLRARVIAGSPLLAVSRRFWVIAGGAVILAATGAIVLALNQGMAEALASTISRAEDRSIIYRNSLFLALEFPFSGIGPGGVFGQMYSRFQLLILPTFIGYAHNLVLGIWLAQGILGVIGFVWLLIGSLRRVVPGLAQRGPLAQSAAIGAATLLLHGVTDAPQYDNAWPTMALAFGLLGLLVITSVPATTAAAEPPPETRRGAWRWASVGLVVVALLVFGQQLTALGMANLSAVLQARATLSPGLTQRERADLLREAGGWADYSLRLNPNSAAAQKRIGVLALNLGDYPRAINALEFAQQSLSADQATRKALGMAYIWNGEPERGARILATLDDATEVREELDIWPQAWLDRGRSDLAAYARQAAQAMDALRRAG